MVGLPRPRQRYFGASLACFSFLMAGGQASAHDGAQTAKWVDPAGSGTSVEVQVEPAANGRAPVTITLRSPTPRGGSVLVGRGTDADKCGTELEEETGLEFGLTLIDQRTYRLHQSSGYPAEQGTLTVSPDAQTATIRIDSALLAGLDLNCVKASLTGTAPAEFAFDGHTVTEDVRFPYIADPDHFFMVARAQRGRGLGSIVGIQLSKTRLPQGTTVRLVCIRLCRGGGRMRGAPRSVRCSKRRRCFVLEHPATIRSRSSAIAVRLDAPGHRGSYRYFYAFSVDKAGFLQTKRERDGEDAISLAYVAPE
jgi:hypothetical protein